MNDYPGRKQFSIYNKLLAASGYSFVTDDFVMFNDDHFLLQPLSVSGIKYWYDGTLENKLSSSGRERQATQNTIELLTKDHYNFDIHVPIIYNKERFKSIFASMQQEVCIKSLYCNNLGIVNNKVHMPDMKIDGQYTKQQIKNAIAGRMFFSTGTMLVDPMPALLGELFPVKSEFEK